MQIHSVGIDLDKTTFHLVALGDHGKVLLKKKFTQRQLITFTANLQTPAVGMEVCSGAHFLGLSVASTGPRGEADPAQFVKPFVKSRDELIDGEDLKLLPVTDGDLFRSDGRSAGPASPASCARTLDGAEDFCHQPDSCVSVGAWHSVCQEPDPVEGKPFPMCSRTLNENLTPRIGIWLRCCGASGRIWSSRS